jgi:hypothetical protein
MPLSNKVADRLITGIKHFQPILVAAKARDAGEADTVTIIKDMLGDVSRMLLKKASAKEEVTPKTDSEAVEGSAAPEPA